MILLVTDNVYLVQALKELMYPLHVNHAQSTLDIIRSVVLPRYHKTVIIDTRFHCPGWCMQYFSSYPDSTTKFILFGGKKIVSLLAGDRATISSCMHPFDIREVILQTLNTRDAPVNAGKTLLTRKEKMVLTGFLSGYDLLQTAAMMNITEKGAYSHQRSICLKMGVRRICQVWQ